MKLNIHATAQLSSCNGPGQRIVVWFQGCKLDCFGCFNRDTHSADGGFSIPVNELAKQINVYAADESFPPRGVTLSGGEPLSQPRAIKALLDLIDPKLDVLLYTGYEFDEIRRSSAMCAVVCRCDAVLAGRYAHDSHHPYEAKSLILRTNRILPEEIRPHQMIEVLIDGSDCGIITGFPRRQ